MVYLEMESGNYTHRRKKTVTTNNPIKDQAIEQIAANCAFRFKCLLAYKELEWRFCMGSKLIPAAGWRYGDIKTSALDIRPDPIYGEEAKQMHLAKHEARYKLMAGSILINNEDVFAKNALLVEKLSEPNGTIWA